MIDKLYMKAQDKGHWLLPQALDNLGRLYVLANGQLSACLLRETMGDDMTTNLVAMEIRMWEALISNLKKLVKPFTEYVSYKAHTTMALMCDHRYRRGGIYFWTSDS